MTSNDFVSACEARTIDLAIALENPLVQAALFLNLDDDEVCWLLDTEF